MNERTDQPHEHCGEDLAAFALGALSDHEAERLRRHLTGCTVCAEELAAFRQVVDAVAVTPPRLSAPAGLRRRVMRAVADEPRLDPASRRERRRGQLSRPLPRPTFALGGGLLALAAVIVAVVIVVSSGSGSGSGRTYGAQVTGRGMAALRVRDGRGELIVERFPAPPPGKIYEVWLKHDTTALQPTSALFDVTGSGSGDVDVPGSLRGVTQVLVSPEPAGGSPKPTHAPVISVRLN